MDASDRAPRTKRARYEDIVVLQARIAELEARLDAQPVDALTMPMTKDLFMGLAALAMLAGGDATQLKYLHQQVPFAYAQWERAVLSCRVADAGSDEQAPALSESVS